MLTVAGARRHDTIRIQVVVCLLAKLSLFQSGPSSLLCYTCYTPSILADSIEIAYVCCLTVPGSYSIVREMGTQARNRNSHVIGNAPRMPALGVSMPTSTGELGCSWSGFFPKRSAAIVREEPRGRAAEAGRGCCAAVEYPPSLVPSTHPLLLVA